MMTTSAPTEFTLVLFCRRPVAGSGKRRIAAGLGDALAFELSALLLDAALEDARAWPGPVIVAPAADADAGWAQNLAGAPRGHAVLAQPPGNLGERLNHVDRALREAGHRRLVFIGSDAPVLTETDYHLAREALAHHDVVLGPAADGGVTLMGCARPWPALDALPWGGDRLGMALARLCRAAGYSLATTPPRYDVDLPADLPHLYADIAEDGRPARSKLAAWLKDNQLHHDDGLPDNGPRQ